MKPTHNEIAVRAYFLWEKAGHPEGDDWTHWFQAEAECGYDWHKKGRMRIQFPHGPLSIPFR